MSDRIEGTIEVLGVEACRLTYRSAEAATPLGPVWVGYSRQRGWHAIWRPSPSVEVRLGANAASPADAAREATRRLRAIRRACARAGTAATPAAPRR